MKWGLLLLGRHTCSLLHRSHMDTITSSLRSSVILSYILIFSFNYNGRTQIPVVPSRNSTLYVANQAAYSTKAQIGIPMLQLFTTADVPESSLFNGQRRERKSRASSMSAHSAQPRNGEWE